MSPEKRLSRKNRRVFPQTPRSGVGRQRTSDVVCLCRQSKLLAKSEASEDAKLNGFRIHDEYVIRRLEQTVQFGVSVKLFILSGSEDQSILGVVLVWVLIAVIGISGRMFV